MRQISGGVCGVHTHTHTHTHTIGSSTYRKKKKLQVRFKSGKSVYSILSNSNET